MKDFTLSQQYAILGLDGIESLHSSFAKNAVIRGIFVARELEKIFENAAEDMDASGKYGKNQTSQKER